MLLQVHLDDRHINELINEAAQQLIETKVNEIVYKSIKDHAMQVAKQYIESKEIQDIMYETIEKEMQSSITNLIAVCYRVETGKNRHYAEAKLQSAISEVLYDNKDVLIEEVIKRASRHIEQKANKVVMEKLIKDLTQQI